MAFVRVSESPIRTREKVYEPNIVIVLDPTLLKLVNVEAGLKPGGMVIVNTTKSAQDLRKETGIKAKLAVVDASKIAMETMRVPITNTDHAWGFGQGGARGDFHGIAARPHRSSFRPHCGKKHELVQARLR